MHAVWPYIKNLRNRRWLAATWAGIGAGVLVLIWFVVPRALQTYQRYQVWQDNVQRIESIENWERQLSQLQAEEARLQQQLDSLFVSLPRSDQMSVVLDELHRHARESGVRIRQLQPRQKSATQTFEEFPLSVQLRGKFHPMVRFIDRVERSKYLMKMKEVHLQSTAMLSDTLQTTLQLTVVTLTEPPSSSDARSGSNP